MKEKQKFYIVIPELPKEQQEPFSNWLRNQTAPVIEEEGENRFNCAYRSDYNKWLSYWLKKQVAPIND